MAIEIWPSFKSGLKHIDQISAVSSHSFLPHRDYKHMSSESFRTTITNDFHEFIMTHDVKADHLYDYMNDILELLMI